MDFSCAVDGEICESQALIRYGNGCVDGNGAVGLVELDLVNIFPRSEQGRRWRWRLTHVGSLWRRDQLFAITT